MTGARSARALVRLAEFGTGAIEDEDWDRLMEEAKATKTQRAKPKKVYGTSAIKRTRRTRDEIEDIEDAICDLLDDYHPMTIRQLYYQLVTTGAIPKTEAEYRTTTRLALNLRRNGTIPYSCIADNTRWMRKPRSFTGMEAMLDFSLETYRRALWIDQPVYVEVWLEKDALAGVLYEVTSRWDVPLMVSRGYASETYLYEAAQAIINAGKPAYLYYFGDYDPSGLNIPEVIERRLRGFAPDCEIHFKRMAVLPEQITEWHLPTRPTKKSDTRSRGFRGESVEVDAIPPAILRGLVSEVITQHLDSELLKKHLLSELIEKESLGRIMKVMKDHIAVDTDPEALR